MDTPNTHTPELTQLYCYISDSCNCRCKHCWISPDYSRDGNRQTSLDVNLFSHVVRQAMPLGLNRVKFTGGEPLLHPRILDLISIVNSHNIRLSMESNGMLMTSKIASALADNIKPGVALSLDGASSKTHDGIRGVQGSFESVLKAASLLYEKGIQPQFIMTVLRSNVDEVESMIELARKHHAWSLKFNILQPSNRGESLFKKNENLSVPELVALGRKVETILTPTAPIQLFFSHPPAFRPLSKIFGKHGENYCGIRGILGLLADGTYALCGVGAFIQSLTMGHAQKDKLAELWPNNTILNRLRKKLPGELKGICSQCLLKSRCLGGCIAQNYISSLDLFAPYWFCAEADKLDLFPHSRKIPVKKS